MSNFTSSYFFHVKLFFFFLLLLILAPKLIIIKFLKLPIQNGVWHCLELNSVQIHALLHLFLAVVILSNLRVRIEGRNLVVSPLPVLGQPLGMLQCGKYLQFDVLLLSPSLQT